MRGATKAAAVAAVLLAGFSGAAIAAPGYVTGDVNFRAGPSTRYPSAGALRAGTPVEIHGCLQGWTWCDVDVNGARGWVSGSRLQVVYDNRRVLVPGYGPRIGLPIVGFDFGDYWGRYYRDRPWFSDRDRWGGPLGPGPARAGPGGPAHGGPGFDHGRGFDGRPGHERGPGPRHGPGDGPGFGGPPDR